MQVGCESGLVGVRSGNVSKDSAEIAECLITTTI